MANWETKARSKLKLEWQKKEMDLRDGKLSTVPDSLCFQRMEREASQMTTSNRSGSKNVN